MVASVASVLETSSGCYVCPEDKSLLESKATNLYSPSSKRSYPITKDGIALLDIVKSDQAEAFDEVHRTYNHMNTDEVEASSRLASKFLSLLPDLSRVPNNILDVACGKGELTIGLRLSEDLIGTEIYAFDHSVESLRALARTAEHLGIRERINISSQDADRVAFPSNHFDVIFGNAILHHFLDYQGFLAQCKELLKPGGAMIFAEPFVEGYLIAMAILKFARRMTSPKKNISSENLGLFDFIVEDIGYRVRNAEKSDELKDLTDKHLFTLEQFINVAHKLGMRITFEPFEHSEYYKDFMNDILKTYRIIDEDLCKAANDIHDEFLSYVGDKYARLFCHFRLIRFENDK